MCWLPVAPKTSECQSQCCCTLIATMNALEVSTSCVRVFVRVWIHTYTFTHVKQQRNIIQMGCSLPKLLLHHLGYSLEEIFCGSDK